jgi:hypothetical protein
MKKALTLSLMLMVAVAAAAAADDGIGNDTGAFQSPYGAKVRLLMLQSSLEQNIAAGNEVVSAIKEKNSSTDTAELEAILAQMSALRDEVASASENPGSGDEAAKIFVDLKDDATALAKDFRERARELVKPGEIDGLRGRIRNITKEERKELKEKINETRRQYNAQAIREILSAAGITDADLINRVLSGEAKLKDVRAKLKDQLQNMSKEQKREAMKGLQEQWSKRNVFTNFVQDKIRQKQLERLQDRLERRLNRTAGMNLSDGARKRLENRTEWVQKRIEKANETFQKRLEHIENITDRKTARIDNQIDLLENRSDKLQDKLNDRLETGNLTDKQKGRVIGRIGRIENRTDAMTDKLEERKEKVQENGDKLQEKLEGRWANRGKGGNQNGGGGQ